MFLQERAGVMLVAAVFHGCSVLVCRMSGDTAAWRDFVVVGREAAFFVWLLWAGAVDDTRYPESILDCALVGFGAGVAWLLLVLFFGPVDGRSGRARLPVWHPLV